MRSVPNAPKSSHLGRRDLHHVHLSALVREISALPLHMPQTVGSVVAHFQDRGLAALLALLALPIALPVPMPGISAIFGLPMLLLALQLTFRKRGLSLPRAIRERSLDADRLRQIGTHASHWLERLERVLRPRLKTLCHPWFQSAYGVICAWLSLILILPIPFGNVLPSLSIFVIALAILEKDGLAAIVGMALASISFVVTGGAMIGAILGLAAIMRRYLNVG